MEKIKQSVAKNIKSDILSEQEIQSLKIVLEEIQMLEVTETDIVEFITTINGRLQFLKQQMFSSQEEEEVGNF